MKHALAVMIAAGLAFSGAAGGEQPVAERAEFVRLKAFVDDPAPLGIGRMVPDLLTADFEGEPRRLSERIAGGKGIAIIFTSVTCPLSMRYAPRLTKMADEYAAKGIRFAMLNVSDTDTLPEMRRDAREQKWKHGYMPDADRALRRAFAPRTTTEVLVLDASRTLVYRGAVDDQFGVGSGTDAPRNTWLRDALDAVVAGEAVRVPATWSPGCAVDPPPEDAPRPPEPGAPTYSNQIARIVQNHCLECHHQGGSAPFALDTYSAVAGRAAMIGVVVKAGLMPPWGVAPAAPGHGGAGHVSPWAADRSMPEKDRADLLAWLDSPDRPVGDSGELPVPRVYKTGWSMGPPDMLLVSSSVLMPAEGPMISAELVAPATNTEPVWVSVVELQPRRRMMMHHAVVSLIEPESKEAGLPARERLIGTFGPSNSVISFPKGAAMRLPVGASFRVRVWLRPVGSVMKEPVRIALGFADAPPERRVEWLELNAADLLVPAGSKRRPVSTSLTLERPVRVLALTPCLRSRGRSAVITAKRPGGEPEVLLDVARYNYAWRTRYEYREPLELPAGTVLTLTGTFDNEGADDVTAGTGPTNDWLAAVIETVEPVAADPAR